MLEKVVQLAHVYFLRVDHIRKKWVLKIGEEGCGDETKVPSRSQIDIQSLPKVLGTPFNEST